MKFLSKFKNDEDGAVTVDWVVLTAGVVILAGIAMTAVQGALGDITQTVQDAIADPLGGGTGGGS
tara:strand:+ start:5323 stop:5517 length:195 start_codon:yes stop_codon:yes gene_type:complete